MPKLYRYLVFLFMLLIAACSKSDDPSVSSPSPNPAPPTVPAPTPVPGGSRRISITVDSQYDLRNTKAYSLMDSITMKAEASTMLAPSGFKSAVFFKDGTSGKILALVRTPTTSANVVVNAETVADALLTLIPAYQTLSVEQKPKFEQNGRASKPYQDFVQLVDGLLKSKRPIYSTDASFLTQALALNSYILQEYLGNPKREGGRLTTAAIKAVKNGGSEFPNLLAPPFYRWMLRKNGGTIH
ncbi:hypothetical protein SAMN00120144_3206 [Hymenobacter roseosalivarius DSM 11622]|uniref:Uncharacterized protein n=1 Tax=Hymenobacter roseosalivarius DSM 11622 TaxID=645990 RepID=A0A1W1W3K2_9BACT|nr:hypothetical protein [Hymenobacter roseosalivarius]SMB99951.1 hypothetical protein SAMN00120144_3206 [Hymenobacter roseosalivarius DSM 11622]